MTKGLKGFQKGNKHWCERKTHSHSDKTKKKISDANKGKVAWNTGNRAYESKCLYCEKIIKESVKRKYCSHICSAKSSLLGKDSHEAWNKGMGLGKNYKKVEVRIDGRKKLVSHIVWEENNPREIIGFCDVIHHIDGNPEKNEIKNLKKMSRSSHVKYHHELNKQKVIIASYH